MKKLYISFVLIICMFSLSCCSFEKTSNASTINDEIAYLICSEVDYENLSDETIKSLSVIYRSNLKFENNKNLSNEKNFDERVYKLVNETENETLNNFGIETNEKIYIYNKSDDKWKISISKAKLLEFCSKKNISLTNISKIESKYNEDNTLKSIIIADKEFSFEEIKQNFNIPSNKNLSVNLNVSSLEINGTYDSKNSFNINKSENLANENYDYKTILIENFK